MGVDSVVHNAVTKFLSLLWSEDGPTTTEYAVMVGVICVAVIGSLSLFGEHMGNVYTIINSALSVF